MSANRGRTRNPAYRNVCQLYEFDKLRAWYPRNITPTDIDGRYYIHSCVKRHAFWFFELKTEGTKIPTGQRRALAGLCALSPGRNVAMIAEHPALEDVDVPPDLLRFYLLMYDAATGALHRTDTFEKPCDGHVRWWMQQWFWHVEESRPNHFVTAFRQKSHIYPTSR